MRRDPSIHRAGGPLVFAALVLLSGGEARGDNSRGQKWVRAHPFTLMALTITPDTFDVPSYRDGAGLNTLLPWKPRIELFERAAAHDLPWHFHQRPHPQGLTEEMKGQFRELHDSYRGCSGWMVWDEPQTRDMPLAAKTLAWLRENYPDKLVYSNALPNGAPTMAKYYGGNDVPANYSYERYLRDFVTIVKPDVLMYDAYIFKESGKTSDIFSTAIPARRVALEAGLPYWTFVQSHSDPIRKYRMPSESDVRMQVFLHLTLGFTGIAYFTYELQQGPAMVDPPAPGVRNPIFYHVGRLNREVANLGKSLRFLESTAIRSVSPPGNKGAPKVSRWEPGAGLIPEIEAITINDREADHWKEVLLGYFKADDGRRYFMVTNLWHGMHKSSAERQLSVRLKLAPGVKVVGRLSRETGQGELLAVRDGILILTLPGGTGDLLCLGHAEFPGLK